MMLPFFRSLVKKSLPVTNTFVNSNELLNINNLTIIPGEIYPDHNIRLIKVTDNESDFISCEPCCGTHAISTNNLMDFCIINVKLSTKGCYIFYGTTGIKAQSVSIFIYCITQSKLVQHPFWNSSLWVRI